MSSSIVVRTSNVPAMPSAMKSTDGQAMAVSAQLGPEGAPIAEAATAAFLDGWALSMTIASVLAFTAAAGTAAMLRNRAVEDEVIAAEEPELAAAL